MRLLTGAGLVLLAVLAALTGAAAQDYPTRGTTILVPFAPGGGTDLLARAVAQKLEHRLGKPFVIENRTGAGTVVAATAASKAAPDGYTLMQATSGTMAMNGTIFKSLSYDPGKDLIPVSLLAGVPFILVVHPSLGVKSIPELAKVAKERTLSYGSGGLGAFHHLNAELLSSMLGIKMTHVPYRGSLPAMTDLVAGHFQLLFVDIGPSLELVRAGKAVALGISSAEAFPTAPEIRPLNTVGLPGFDTTAWQMLVAPAGTPRPILEKLNAEGNAAVKSPDVEKRLNDLGMTALGKGSLEELEKFVKSETGRWGKVIREAGLAGSQ